MLSYLRRKIKRFLYMKQIFSDFLSNISNLFVVIICIKRGNFATE